MESVKGTMSDSSVYWLEARQYVGWYGMYDTAYIRVKRSCRSFQFFSMQACWLEYTYVELVRTPRIHHACLMYYSTAASIMFSLPNCKKVTRMVALYNCRFLSITHMCSTPMYDDGMAWSRRDVLRHRSCKTNEQRPECVPCVVSFSWWCDDDDENGAVRDDSSVEQEMTVTRSPMKRHLRATAYLNFCHWFVLLTKAASNKFVRCALML